MEEGNSGASAAFAIMFAHPDTTSPLTPINPTSDAVLPIWNDPGPYMGLDSYRPSSIMKARGGGAKSSSTW
jgi:hypothetical protein